MKQEDWINEILNSAGSIDPVLPSKELLDRLSQVVPKETKGTSMTARSVWMAAAGLALLILLNVFTLRQYKKSQTVQEETVFETYYDHLNNYNV